MQILPQKLAALPTDKTWFAIMVGFLTGTVLWVVEVGDDTINLAQLFKGILALFAIYVLAALVIKWRLGGDDNSHHWLVKTLNFLAYASWYGIASSAIVWDVCVFFGRRYLS